MDKTISKTRERTFFGRAEKLKSKKLIDLLFKDGKPIRKNSVKCLYIISDEPSDSTVQVMVSVPKRLFKRALDRNLVKRRIRETYRLNKNQLINICRIENRKIILAFIFLHSEVENYNIIENDVQEIISELIRRLNRK